MEDRNYILDKMKGRIMTVDEFDYSRLWAPPLYSLLTPADIDQLHKIATSIRYSGKPIEKLQAIDNIMKSRGFRKFGGGTNRMVYKFLEDDRFVVKVATSEVALNDSPREFLNQVDLEPFCAKCFEVSPCGTVGLFERVRPITSREEFASVADMVYDLISNVLIGEYVMDDIGSKCFMNYGVRKGFGVVILDYTYRYKLDGNKLYCNNVLPDGSHCGGIIDYDDGFNKLRCTKCGRVYKAIELKTAIDKSMVLQKGGSTKMKVAISRGDVTAYNDTEKYIDTAPKLVSRKKGKKSKVGHLKVAVYGRTEYATNDDDDEEESVHINARGTIVHGRTDDEIAEAEEQKEAKADNRRFKAEVDKLDREMHSEDNDDEEEEEDYQEADVKYDNVKADVNKLKKELYSNSEDDTVDVDDEYSFEENDEDNDMYYGDTDVYFETGYIECTADVISSSEIDGDEDHAFKALIVYDDDVNPVESADGKYYLISTLMGKSLDNLAILDKSAYVSLLNEVDNLKDKLDQANDEIESLQKTSEEDKEETYDSTLDVEVSNDNENDDGLEYYIDEKGIPRWKTNHNVYKKPIPEQEVKYDTSSKLIPVGSTPPKYKKGKEGKRPINYDDEDGEYFNPNKIKNNKRKSSKRR